MAAIQQLLGTFDLTLAAKLAFQVLLALVLGALVGLERERRNRPAGIRTFTLVSIGSCIFTILSYRGFLGSDPARIAAQIVTGIGFLGAGVMIQRKGTIYGLTSAAGIWAVAAVGMAVGTENYFLAVFGDVTIYVVLSVLRRWFKADAVRSARRTLNTALRQVRLRIQTMGGLTAEALQTAVTAVAQESSLLAQQVIDNDEQINDLRYTIEEECLDILRTHHPAKIHLRTVVAASHIATNLERMGDYAKEIARIRLQMGSAALLVPLPHLSTMSDRICELLDQVLNAFDQDDVDAASQVWKQTSIVDQGYDDVVQMISEAMADRKPKHFGRGAQLLSLAHYLKLAADRVSSIAHQIVFARTGTLRELETPD